MSENKRSLENGRGQGDKNGFKKKKKKFDSSEIKHLLENFGTIEEIESKIRDMCDKEKRSIFQVPKYQKKGDLWHKIWLVYVNWKSGWDIHRSAKKDLEDAIKKEQSPIDQTKSQNETILKYRYESEEIVDGTGFRLGRIIDNRLQKDEPLFDVDTYKKFCKTMDLVNQHVGSRGGFIIPIVATEKFQSFYNIHGMYSYVNHMASLPTRDFEKTRLKITKEETIRDTGDTLVRLANMALSDPKVLSLKNEELRPVLVRLKDMLGMEEQVTTQFKFNKKYKLMKELQKGISEYDNETMQEIFRNGLYLLQSDYETLFILKNKRLIFKDLIIGEPGTNERMQELVEKYTDFLQKEIDQLKMMLYKSNNLLSPKDIRMIYQMFGSLLENARLEQSFSKIWADLTVNDPEFNLIDRKGKLLKCGLKYLEDKKYQDSNASYCPSIAHLRELITNFFNTTDKLQNIDNFYANFETNTGVYLPEGKDTSGQIIVFNINQDRSNINRICKLYNVDGIVNALSKRIRKNGQVKNIDFGTDEGPLFVGRSGYEEVRTKYRSIFNDLIQLDDQNQIKTSTCIRDYLNWNCTVKHTIGTGNDEQRLKHKKKILEKIFVEKLGLEKPYFEQHFQVVLEQTPPESSPTYRFGGLTQNQWEEAIERRKEELRKEIKLSDRAASVAETKGEGDMCCICLCDFEKGDSATEGVMICNNGHFLHENCKKTYMRSYKKPACPYCRSKDFIV